MVFKKWVKNIQTAAYNGARTVCNLNFDKICRNAEMLVQNDPTQFCSVTYHLGKSYIEYLVQDQSGASRT